MATGVTLCLYASSLHSYILFHSLIEFTTIAIAFTLFILAWNTRRFLTGGFLKALGIGYGLIALVDLLHTLSYYGMGVFPSYGANLPTQLWIAARSLQALLLCVAPLFARRDINEHLFFGISLAAVSVTTALIFSGFFPDCFIEGKGLTPFKIVAEYVISAFLLLALFLFIRKRSSFNAGVFTLIIASVLCTIGSELAFTSYLSVYGPANMVGHFLKLAAFYLIYRALVVTGFKEPFELIFRELKQTERALKQEREFGRCLLESMADGVVACDANGILALFNRSAREWHGMDPMGIPPEEWAQHYDLFRLDGMTPLPTEEIPLARAFRGEMVRDAGMAIRAQGKAPRFILSNGSVIQDETGQKLGAVVVMHDITGLKNAEKELRIANEELERRVEERTSELTSINKRLQSEFAERERDKQLLAEAEAKYRCLVEESLVGVYLIQQGLFVYVNSCMARVFGYHQEEVLGRPVEELVVPEDRVLVSGNIQKRETGKVTSMRYSFHGLCKDGHVIDVEVLGTRTVYNGRPAVIGSLLDITEQRKAEEEVGRLYDELEKRVTSRTYELQETQGALMNIVEDLNEKTGELEEANMKLKELDRLKSMFIASMSHELRTPLNSIIGFSSILQDEWLGPVSTEQKENLGIIRQSGRHLLNLINDVIDVSKIEAGKIESILEEFDLQDLILDAVNMVKKELEEKGLVLHIEVGGHPMHTDKRRLLQCVLNLLSNAVKYTEKGSVLVETRTTQCIKGMGEESMVEIAVTDTGIGIDREGVKRLFQPFVRLSTPNMTIVPGTGLGLYLSRKLAVEVLKGDITVTSEYGRGSRFVIRVPSRLS